MKTSLGRPRSKPERETQGQHSVVFSVTTANKSNHAGPKSHVIDVDVALLHAIGVRNAATVTFITHKLWLAVQAIASKCFAFSPPDDMHSPASTLCNVLRDLGRIVEGVAGQPSVREN